MISHVERVYCLRFHIMSRPDSHWMGLSGLSGSRFNHCKILVLFFNIFKSTTKKEIQIFVMCKNPRWSPKGKICGTTESSIAIHYEVFIKL